MEQAATSGLGSSSKTAASGGARPCEVCGALRFATIGEKSEHRFERCDRCGLERIEPAPTDATLEKIYGQHYYDAWGLQTDTKTVESLKRGTFGRIIKGLGPLRTGARVLDCGAATGFLMGLAKDLGYEPFGAELSEFGANQIAERFGRDHVHQGQLEDAKFEDGFFDAIFMCDYLEHVRDPQLVLKKAFALLAPGGKIILSTPRVGSLTHAAMRLKWTHYKVEHLYYFSLENLRTLLENVGFADFRGKPLIKTMNLQYIAYQFSVYPHPVISPMVRSFTKAAPAALRNLNFPVAMGELVAYATKR